MYTSTLLMVFDFFKKDNLGISIRIWLGIIFISRQENLYMYLQSLYWYYSCALLIQTKLADQILQLFQILFYPFIQSLSKQLLTI
jgi:hypothetical protein